MSILAPNSIVLSALSAAKLTSATNSSISIAGNQLWKEQPCVIMVVRRPGCKLCRAQALQLAEIRDRLAAMNIKLAAVSHQTDSIEEFSRDYFNKNYTGDGSVWIDVEKSFYKALGEGGKVNKKNTFLGLFSWRMFSNNSEADKLGAKGNLSGEGGIMGGVLLVGKGDSGVKWAFREVEFGDKAPQEELLKACEALQ